MTQDWLDSAIDAPDIPGQLTIDDMLAEDATSRAIKDFVAAKLKDKTDG